MSDKRNAPELAVIIPLEDPRGDVGEHIGTWSCHQTLDRDRYQVVLGADGRHPDFERRVASDLAPQDKVVSVPGGSLMELYDGAARAADAPILVFTEAHVISEPESLAATLELFAGDTEVDAATFAHSQHAPNDIGELSERWFRRVHSIWADQNWPRLNPGGMAITAATYERAGGIDPELELFAPSFLSARVDEQGARVRHIPEARVTHFLEDNLPESLGQSASFARGECTARAKYDAEFLDRYFGSAGLWDRRLSYRPDVAGAMVAALAGAIRRSPGDRRWLLRELAARLPARAAGARPRLAWESGIVGFNRRLTGSSRVDMDRRWRAYIAATEHSLSAVRLSLGTSADDPPDPLGPGGSLAASDLDGVLAGTYAAEKDEEGGLFRWSEPVALLRLAPPAEGSVMRLLTGGFRGAPLTYLHGVYVGSQPLPPECTTGDDEALEIRIPAPLTAAVSASGLTLILRPLVPAHNGSSDRRRLGIPLVSVQLRAA